MDDRRSIRRNLQQTGTNLGLSVRRVAISHVAFLTYNETMEANHERERKEKFMQTGALL